MTDEDNSLFLNAMKDVNPIKQDNKFVEHYDSEKVSKQIKRQLRQRKSQQESSVLSLENPITNYQTVKASDNIGYSQKGVRIQEINKLKNSDFQLDDVLDLHGLTEDEAYTALTDFIQNCIHNNARYIRVIHGKGYNSDQEFPILKNLVNQTVRQMKEVIAFHSTPTKDGGTGAINLLLRKA